MYYTAICQDIEQIGKNKYRYTFTINSNMPNYIFTLLLGAPENDYDPSVISVVSKIIVSRSDSKKPIQVLTNPKPMQQYYPSIFQAIDLNFDGYLDLALEWNSASGGSNHVIWLFDPRTGKFNFNSKMSEVNTPTPDPQSKTLTSVYAEGISGAKVETYRFINNEFTLVSDSSWYNDQKHKWTITTTKKYHYKNKVLVKIDTTQW